MSEITIGMLREADAEELRAVAERDSRRVPAGSVLGARIDGRLVAARSLDGHAVADPFVPTAEVQKLLAQRASQIRGSNGSGLRHALARLSTSQSSSASSRVAA